jgi:hypothetical protein
MFFAIPFSSGQDEASLQPAVFLTGKVTSENGEPLAGVKVEWEAGSVDRTDADGFYYSYSRYKTPIDNKDCCRIRFSLTGFKTLTKAMDADVRRLDVVLQSGDNKWVPFICKSSPEDNKRIGWKMKLLIPQRTPVSKFSDGADTLCQHVHFNSGTSHETMRICTGPLWGGMWPEKDLLIRPSTMDERHWYDKSAFDYHGSDRGGNRWRHTGWFNETIDYRNASDQAADFFDSIIDNLCWDASAFPKDK